MKSVIFSVVSAVAMFSFGNAAPAADALPMALAESAPAPAAALCDLPGPPTASLVDDVSIASLVAANGGNSTLSKRADGTFQVFTGDRCDARRIVQVGINNGVRCVGNQGGHSFAVLGCSATITLFELDSCRGRSNTVRVGQGCFNVNTGYNWGSSSIACI